MRPITGRAETYDVSEAEWYQKALAADGDIVFTDAYMDAITGRPVVTIAKRCGHSERVNIMAFDIFPENFQIAVNPQNLPVGGSYYLCDTKGTLLYAHTETEGSSREIQEYVKQLFGQIEAGEVDAPGEFVYDLEGAKRGVYYTAAPNGWMSIITVPFSTILGDLQTFTLWFLMLLIGLLVVGMSAREHVLNRRIERTNETVRVLGNSYYAIYRVNVEQETYDMIKGSDYIRRNLPQQGPYADLLHHLGSVIESKASEEFQSSFSIQNIRDLMGRRVRNFGGEFRRIFDQELRWVQIQMLFDESLNRGEVVLCFREIDEEKGRQLQQMQLLQNSLDAAHKSEQSQKNFFSSVSHEMRTPLNAILGLTELAGNYVEDSERIKDYLGKIETSSRQLLGLINDILELSRMEQGGMTLDRL